LTKLFLTKIKSVGVGFGFGFGLNLDNEFNWIFNYPIFSSMFYVMNVILQCLQKSISLDNIKIHLNNVNIQMEKIICGIMNTTKQTEGDLIFERLKIDMALEVKTSIHVLYCIKCGGDRNQDIYATLNNYYNLGKDIHNIVILLVFFNVDFNLLKNILINLYKDKIQLLEVHSLITCLYGKDIYSKIFMNNQIWDTSLYDKIVNIRKKKILFFSMFLNSNGKITRNEFMEKCSTVEPLHNQPLNLDEFYDCLINKFETNVN
jgi:hypothetical protein